MLQSILAPVCRSFGPACLALLLAVSPVRAHPHAWIDVQGTIILDEKGRIEAIDFSWLFDEWYTLVVIDEVGGGTKADLDSIARRNIENLRPHGYFTEVTRNDAVVALGRVTDYAAELNGARLQMRFNLPLAQPLDPRSEKIAYRVFDPTFYIEMLHIKGDPVRFVGRTAESCGYRRLEPNPSLEAVALASALDKTQSAGGDLGKLFAETIEIHCS